MTEGAASAARSAIEALRAGVPNRAAIRLLGTNEPTLRQEFLDRLRLCGAAFRAEGHAEGLAIAGAFGAGKSHQLGYLGLLAREENFIVSLVPISKETPLFDPARLFAAAVRAALVPEVNDDLMTAVTSRLRPDSEPYEALQYWTAVEVQRGRLSSIFTALLQVIPHIVPDDHARVARFFGGGKLNVTMVKAWLREAGAARMFELKPVRQAQLALQRLHFAPRLFQAAGYSGWCILLDEVELIGRYSPLQRGRSYAELVRWLGLDREERIPGLLTVAAITDDFPDQMFQVRRDDELIAPRLETKGLVREAALARDAIDWLKRRQFRLTAPDEAVLRRGLDEIRDLYREAYDWTPPATEIGERLAGKSMRQYVKSWITIWDIERLYGQTPKIEAGTILFDFSESSDLEQASGFRDDDTAG